MHGQRIIGPEGLEAIWPGNDPYTATDHEPIIPDWISYGLDMGQKVEGAYGSSPDYRNTIVANRDRHYQDNGQSIDLLKGKCQGKRFLIVCPGPSCSEVLGSCDLPEDVVVLAINKAISYVRLDLPNRYGLIMERNAKEDWLRNSRDDLLVPWVPDCPLITIPESSAWLADMWPVENRFYCSTPFYNVPEDSRARFPKLINWYITPTLALDLARYLGASKIIMVGCDLSFTMNGMYYHDTPCNKHPNYAEHSAQFNALGFNGELCVSSATFAFHRNGLEAIIYWIERTARIPVLNATGAGILDWRPTTLEEALHGTHEPIVDYFTGEVEGPGSRTEPCAPQDVHCGVAQAELQGALASA